MGSNRPFGYAARSVIPARRWAALAAVFLVGVGLLSACSGATPYAAIVNGTTIRQSQLLRELNSLGGNGGFVTTYDASIAQAVAQGQTSLTPIFAKGTASKTFTQGFTAIVLNTDVQAQLIHAEVVRRHIEPSPALIAAATASASAQFPNDASNQPVFPKFDAWFRDEFKLRAAEQTALAKALGPVASDAAAIQKFYDQNPQNFITTQCVSHILVATQSVAASIRSRLAGGADFAAQARQYTTDTGSAIKGGDLGCSAPGGFVAAFEQVADTIPVNQLSQPVHSQFGWHLIKVRSRQLQPLDATNKSRIQAFLKQESPISVFITPALRTGKISVNPAYGTWDPAQPGVVPPIAPPAKAGAPSPITTPTSAAPAPPVSAPSSQTPATANPATPSTQTPASGATPTSGP
jgi:hypothetical protein